MPEATLYLKIDGQGRVVIPKVTREALNITSGNIVRITVRKWESGVDKA